uniref:Zinc finger, MYND-type containing 12 n=1 Tax=Crotalus scutulatus scutulatus TaxID=8738 RepID=A0A1J0R034_CROSS|nr:zinc finger, MYND-type containing 12 [Crotalus scutulatus scutulatus]
MAQKHDVDHQNADWISVHAKICRLLIPLRAAPPFYTSEKERKLGEEQKRNREIFLAEVTFETAQNFLLEGHHEDAIPAALHSLKFSISIYGPDSAELVPAYLALAETSLLGHLSQGEEYLSQAQWIVLKNPQCSYNIQSKLHRNLGLLYAARGNFDDSLYHLANDVYFACCAFGTTSNVAISGGYFHMANIFSRQNKMDIVDSLYAEVVNLWHDHFSHFVGIQYQKLITPAEVDLLSVEDGKEEDVLEKQRAEATEMLNSILHFREQSLRPQPEKEAKLLHALAMFHFLIHDLAKVLWRIGGPPLLCGNPLDIGHRHSVTPSPPFLQTGHTQEHEEKVKMPSGHNLAWPPTARVDQVQEVNKGGPHNYWGIRRAPIAASSQAWAEGRGHQELCSYRKQFSVDF